MEISTKMDEEKQDQITPAEPITQVQTEVVQKEPACEPPKSKILKIDVPKKAPEQMATLDVLGLHKSKVGEFLAKGMPADLESAVPWIMENATDYIKGKVITALKPKVTKESKYKPQVGDVVEEVIDEEIVKLKKPKRVVKKVIHKYDSGEETEEEVIEEVVKVKKPKRVVKKIREEYDTEEEERPAPSYRDIMDLKQKQAIEDYNRIFGDN